MTQPVSYMSKRCLFLSRNDLINILSQEKLRYELALMMAHGNMPLAAEYAGISIRQLYRKIEQYGLNVKELLIKTDHEP